MTVEVGAPAEDLSAITMQRTVDELVGDRVHQELWRRRISQTDFAPKLEISQSALSKKLRGERAFGIGELMTVAALLDVPLDDLVPSMDREALKAGKALRLKGGEGPMYPLLPHLDSNQKPADLFPIRACSGMSTRPTDNRPCGSVSRWRGHRSRRLIQALG